MLGIALQLAQIFFKAIFIRCLFFLHLAWPIMCLAASCRPVYTGHFRKCAL